MSKTPTISLPYNDFDPLSVKPKWYNVLSGSRLRNRVIAILTFLSFFLVFVWSLGSGQHTRSYPAPSSFTSKHPYDGVDVTQPAPEHLIIVAGHAIWLGGIDFRNDSSWILQPHQVGQTETLVEHIRKGAELANNQPRSLLIFSGGSTRFHASFLSESQSYAELLELLAKEDPSVRTKHVTTEEFARDSHENLLFSIARFFEVTGQYPKTISVVGYMFKKTRFVEIHRRAVRFPEDRFSYYGIGPVGITEGDLEGEYANAKSHFDHDLYGCKDPDLLGKKKGRNPYRRRHGYELSNPLLAGLISYCPGENDQPYPGKLPWT